MRQSFFKPYVERVGIEKVVSVGSATAEALLDIGLKADIIPDEYSSDGLKSTFSSMDVSDKKIPVSRCRDQSRGFSYLSERQGS